MWECQKCHERHEDSFEVCWNCGTSKAGVEDPGFQPADQIEPASQEQPSSPPVGEIASATVAAHRLAASSVGRNAYEFSPEQNEVIARLAASMRIVGVLSLLAGGFLVLVGFYQLARGDASALIQGVPALVIGGFTLQAAGAFRQIVDAQGDDIGHLMTALAALRNLYRLQVIILWSVLGFLVLALCLVAIWRR
jgi:hypothetical protein